MRHSARLSFAMMCCPVTPVACWVSFTPISRCCRTAMVPSCLTHCLAKVRLSITRAAISKGVWLMAKLPEGIALPDQDKLDTYLLFSNSHDGTLPIDIRLTTVRVVCNNTLTLALRKKDQAHVFRRGHSGSYEVIKAEAEAFFKSVLAQQVETQAAMEKLVSAKCSDDAFAAFLKQLLPDPTRPATANANRAVERGFDNRMWSAKYKVHQRGLRSRMYRCHASPTVTACAAC